MGKTRPKDIGTAAETAVVRFLRENGWPHAERRALHGSVDLGDVTGTPNICWEIKGGQAAKVASDGRVAVWMVEAEQERINSGADVGVLVIARSGIGPANAGRWWAILRFGNVIPAAASLGDRVLASAPCRLHLDTACRLLAVLGYGDGAADTDQGDDGYLARVFDPWGEK